MSKLWKYNGYDDSIGGIPLGTSIKDSFVFQELSPDVDYTEVTDQKEKREFITKNSDIFKDYRLYDLVNAPISIKDVGDINYITELTDGVKLHPVANFTDESFMLKTEWYNGYIDSMNKGDLILVVEEIYTTNPSDDALFPSQRRSLSRQKVRKYVKRDGTIDHFNSAYSTKLYDTFTRSNDEGTRRRNMIVNILTEHTAMGGILSGIFSSEQDAFDKLTSIMDVYSSSISTYIKTGRGNLYDEMASDSNPNHTWLDSVVVDSPQTQAMVPYMVGLDLRNYIITKLKGEIA